MDLLDRYLQAVRFFLPTREHDDIVRELSENLVSEMEDRQEALGRPLTEDEQADVLRRLGHPMLVAGRYRSHQQLIGPAFFPMYVFALKAGIGVCLIVTAVLATIGALVTGDAGAQFVHAMLVLPARALMVFAWTTLGFAALDYAEVRLKLAHTWDPRRLPPVVRREHWMSRRQAFVELLLGGVALVWLLLVPRAPHLLFGAAARILDVAPIWHAVYVPLVVLTAASVVLACLNLARPYWTPTRSLARIGLQVGALAVVGLLLRADVWVVARPGATLPGGAPVDRLLDVINWSCEIGLWLTAVVCFVEIAREGRRLWTRRNDSLSDSSPARARP